MKPTEALFLIGRPFSPIYSLAMKLRAGLYNRGIFKRYPFPVPVISVGNLTMGGTGKTPTVEYVASLMLQKGYRPGIVSRGYGGMAGARVNVVSDGKTVFLDAAHAGDEPYMLAHALPGVAVLTGRKRVYPCKYAIESLQCNILILDDGFQHLSVSRDIDLVLFNATSLAGNSRVFPGGELREPVSALNRASAFLLTGVTEANLQRTQLFGDLLKDRFSEKPVFELQYRTGEVFDQRHNIVDKASLPSPLLAFSGIAHPERFHATLVETGIEVAGTRVLADHARYDQKELSFLGKSATECGAKGFITTHKDIGKIQSYQSDFPIYYLKIRTVHCEALQQFLDAKLSC